MGTNCGEIIGASSVEQLLASGLIAGGDELSQRYSANKPFPHIAIDRFFAPDIAISLGEAISAVPDRDYGVSFRSLAQQKMQLGNILSSAPHVYYAYEALMDSVFTRFIERVSGYPDLEADRQFAGAGLHRYDGRGFSEIHLDSNRHPFDAGLHHRVNLIIFMNPLWRADWGGELVLWSSWNNRPDRPAVVIQPVFNRAVIFEVARSSWHSVNPIRCPHDRARNSMVIYYFNRIGRDDDELPRSVKWHSTHGWPRQAVFEVTNRIMSVAKPYARYLRWLRTNKFDGVSKS
jgi:hypothetical protein